MKIQDIVGHVGKLEEGVKQRLDPKCWTGGHEEA